MTRGSVSSGGAGNDVLNGHLGADRLNGGDGHDRFQFTSALGAGNIDVITDFKGGVDKIVLDHAIFGALAKGAFPASVFHVTSGGAKFGSGDHLIYNEMTGALYYDGNVNAAGDEFQFAVLANKAALSAADFIVV